MQFVERHGIKLTWVPLDPTHEAYLDAKDADDIEAIGSPQAKYVASVIRKRSRGYANDADMKANAAIRRARSSSYFCSLIVFPNQCNNNSDYHVFQKTL